MALLTRLTSEDRAIFRRLPVGIEFEYRFADTFDYQHTRRALREHGSIVDQVCTDEAARLLAERRA